MRNLKRALSLGLTAAMISGLMVMGSSAAGYADVTSENNQEAIEVLQAVGIMTGVDEEGNFNPEGTVTRNQMAVIMANLMEYNVASYRDTSPFTDVPSWAEPYVAACYTNGITSGYSDTIYGGEDSVTTAQAALMLMKALGYFQYASDFGQEWQLATLKQGNAIDLFVGVDSRAEDPLTRNDVAQLVLNTLRAGTVEANTDGSIEIGGVVINNNVTYSYITSNANYATAISSDASTTNTTDANRSIVELGEQLYMGDLQLRENATDAFGRPARYWEYEGSEIGTYAKTELLKQTYTSEVTGKDLYDLLGRNVIEEYSFEIYIDGEQDEDVLGDAYFTEGNLIRSNTKTVGDTGNGVLTEVYVDNDENARDVTIAIINTYLAIASDDYDDRREEAYFDVWSVADENASSSITQLVKNTGEIENLTVSNDDFDVADVVDGDIVLVRVAEGEVQEMIDPEVMEGVEIQAFKNGSWIEVDGAEQKYADSVQYDDEVLDQYDDSNMKDTTYNVYLDPYGFVIGVEIVDEVTNYLFLTGLDEGASNLVNQNLEANAIFLDGTMDTITVNFKESENDRGGSLTPHALMNTWCEYTVDKNGVYTLTEVADDDYSFTNNQSDAKKYDDVGQGKNVNTSTTTAGNTVTLDKSHIKLDGIPTTAFKTVYTNDDTIFLSAETSMIHAANPSRNVVIISDVTGVATGHQNVSLEAWNAQAVKESDSDYSGVALTDISNGAHALFDDEGYVIAVVVVGEDNGSTTNYAYVTSGNMNREGYDKEADEYTWTREAIVNGEVVTLTEIGDTNPELKKMQQGEWYEVRYDANGNVRRVTWLADQDRNNVGDNSTGLTVPAFDFENIPVYNTANEIINNIANVEASVDAEDTVLLWDNLTNDSYSVSVVGSTLQIETDTTDPMGFAVRSDAKTVLIQDSEVSKSGKITYMDDIYEYDGGTSGLERAIKRLNDNDAFEGFIGAVFENGVATSVIIYDKTATDINTGDTNVGGSVDGVYVDYLSDPDDVKVYTEKYTLSEDDAVSAIVDALKNAGWTIDEFSEATPDHWEFKATKANGQKETFKFDYSSDVFVAAVAYTVDGKDALGSGNYPAPSNSYNRYSTDGGETWTYTNSTIAIAKGMEIETGYVKLAVTGDEDDLANVLKDGTDYYADADTVVSKANNSVVGTGYAVNGTYYRYGTYTYGWVNKNDGGASDGTATLTTGQFKGTFHKADGTTVEKPLAATVDLSSESNIEGTYFYLNTESGTPTLKSSATSVNLTRDTDIYGYYVKVTSLSVTDNGVKLNGVWTSDGKSIANGAYVSMKDGVTFTATASEAITTGGTINLKVAATTTTGATADTPVCSDTTAAAGATDSAGSFEFADGLTLTEGSTIVIDFTVTGDLTLAITYTAPVA